MAEHTGKTKLPDGRDGTRLMAESDTPEHKTKREMVGATWIRALTAACHKHGMEKPEVCCILVNGLLDLLDTAPPKARAGLVVALCETLAENYPEIVTSMATGPLPTAVM